MNFGNRLFHNSESRPYLLYADTRAFMGGATHASRDLWKGFDGIRLPPVIRLSDSSAAVTPAHRNGEHHAR
jgi:hypothetical protein